MCACSSTSSSLPARSQDRERDLVGHRRGRQIDRLLLPQERRARSSSASTVGSSRRCSSPTSALTIAASIAGRGPRLRVGAQIDHAGQESDLTGAGGRRIVPRARCGLPTRTAPAAHLLEPRLRCQRWISTCSSDALARPARLPRRPGVGVDGARRGLLRGDDEPARGAARAARRAGAVLLAHVLAETRGARRHPQGALRDGTEGQPVEAVLMRFRDGRRSVCVSSQSGCPLTCGFCATGQMQFRPQPERRRDPRPGAPLPPDRADRPRRLHGDGRADAQPRRGARGGPAPAGARRHEPANDHLDGRLAAGADALHRRADRADPACALAARARTTRCAAG